MYLRLSFAIVLTLALTVPAFAGEVASWKPVGKSYDFTGTREGGRTVGAGVVAEILERTAGSTGRGVVCADTDGDGYPDRFAGGACILFSDVDAAADGIAADLMGTHASGSGTERKIIVDTYGGHGAHGGGAFGINEQGVKYADASEGLEARFQVCVDLDGDGACAGPRSMDPRNACRDRIFSNEVATATGEVKRLNPLPIPRTLVEGDLWRMCARNGGFPGYVVLVRADCPDPDRCTAPSGGRILQVAGAGRSTDQGLAYTTGDNTPIIRGSALGGLKGI